MHLIANASRSMMVFAWVSLACTSVCCKRERQPGRDDPVDPPARAIQAGQLVDTVRRLGTDRIAVFTAAGRMEVWTLGTQPSRELDVPLPEKVYGSEVLPLSLTLAAWCHWTGRAVIVGELPSGKVARQFQNESVVLVAVDGCGRLVSWVDRDPAKGECRLRLAEAESGRLLLDIPLSPIATIECLDSLAISPDSSRIAFGVGSAGVYHVGVVDVASKSVLWQTGEAGGAYRIAFLPDSASFFAVDSGGRLTHYETATGRALWQVKVRPTWERLVAVDVSPDGKRVAVGCDFTRRAMVWDIGSQKQIAVIKPSMHPLWCVLFDPSGEGIWTAGTVDSAISYYPLPGARAIGKTGDSMPVSAASRPADAQTPSAVTNRRFFAPGRWDGGAVFTGCRAQFLG